MKLSIIVSGLVAIATAIMLSQGLPSHSQDSGTPEPPLPAVESGVAQLTEGFQLRSQGDNTGALAAFDEALQLAPNSADTYVAKAAVLYKQGRSIEAIGLYDQALQLDPKLVAAYLGKAQAMARQGKRPAARALLKSAQQNFNRTGEPQRAALIEHLLPGL